MLVFIVKVLLGALLAVTIIMGIAITWMKIKDTRKEIKDIKSGKPFDADEYRISEERKEEIERLNRIDELLDANREKITIVDEETVYLEDDLFAELNALGSEWAWEHAIDKKFDTNLTGWLDFKAEMRETFEND